MTAIFKKEFKSYFTNMIGYLFISSILIIVGIFAAYNNLYLGNTSFENTLSNVRFMFVVLVPLLTMSSFSVEKKQKTDQLLLTSPASVPQIVAGKFFAMTAVYLIPVLILCLYPLIFSAYGTVNFGAAYTAILGLVLMGMAMLAIGMFLSSITESQIIAAIVSIGAFLLIFYFSAIANFLPASAKTSLICMTGLALLIGLLLYALTKNKNLAAWFMIAAIAALVAVYLIDPTLMEGLFPTLLTKLAIFSRVENFLTGILDVTGIVYYLSVMLFFGLLTVQSIEKRRWS